jgi:hypothetical protein
MGVTLAGNGGYHVIALETAKVGPLKPGVFSRLHRALNEHRLITFVKYRKLERRLL